MAKFEPDGPLTDEQIDRYVKQPTSRQRRQLLQEGAHRLGLRVPLPKSLEQWLADELELLPVVKERQGTRKRQLRDFGIAIYYHNFLNKRLTSGRMSADASDDSATVVAGLFDVSRSTVKRAHRAHEDDLALLAKYHKKLPTQKAIGAQVERLLDEVDRLARIDKFARAHRDLDAVAREIERTLRSTSPRHLVNP